MATGFRLALKNETVEHGVFFLSAVNTLSRVKSGVLLERFLPRVPLREQIGGYATLVSHRKATQELGWAPRH